MKLLICLSIVAILCNAQIQIILNQKDVPSTVNNKQQITDQVYTYTTSDNVKIIFDSRANVDYSVINPSAQTDCSKQTFQALNQKNYQSGSIIQQININGVQSEKLVFQQVDTCSSPKASLVNLGIGLQIPASQLTPYLQTAFSSTFRTWTQSFSFYFSGKTNILFIGEQQYYLADSTVTFPIFWKDGNSWQLNVASLSSQTKSYTLPDNKIAYFDTTTSKIVVPPTVYAAIQQEIENIQPDMTQQKCEMVLTAKKQFTFTFQLPSGTNPNNKFTVNLNDLIIKQADGSCHLLLESGDNWILGTSFLKNVYTYFNYDDHTITLGNMNQIKIDSIIPDQTWSTVLIVSGLLVALIALYALTSLVKPLGNIAPTQPKPKVVQQQFIPAQRFIVYQQPMQSVPLNQIISQSPQRILAQSIPQQQMYNQQTIYRQQ